MVINNDAISIQNERKSPAKKSHKKPVRAKLVISNGSAFYGMVKDPGMRECKAPLPPQDQGKYSAMIVKNPDTWTLDGDATIRKCDRLLRKSTPHALCAAFRSLCQAGDLLQNSAGVWHILLIAMLARVLDLATPNLPGIPVIRLKSISDVPPALQVLLQMVNGPKDVHRGDGWKLKRPSVLVPVLDKEYRTHSSHPTDYVGGTYENDYGETKRFWLPLNNCAVAVQTTVPKNILTILFEQWTTAIPIICGDGFKTKNRPTIELDGRDFLTVDPIVLSRLTDSTEHVYAELDYIFFRLHERKKQWRRCKASIDTYLPIVQHGRFVQATASSEAKILATALAVFREILDQAEDNDWVSAEDAAAAFTAAWRAVLPESAPQPPAIQAPEVVHNVAAAPSLTYDSPTLFYHFLSEVFLPTHRDKIVLPGEPVTGQAVGKLHHLGGEPHFITPRTQFLVQYRDYLIKNGIAPFSTQGSDWENPVQAALIEEEIPLKKEGNGSWRCPSFYDAPYRTAKTKTIKFVGLPLSQLPPEVQNSFTTQFGIEIGGTNLPNQAVPESNCKGSGEFY